MGRSALLSPEVDDCVFQEKTHEKATKIQHSGCADPYVGGVCLCRRYMARHSTAAAGRHMDRQSTIATGFAFDHAGRVCAECFSHWGRAASTARRAFGVLTVPPF